MKRGDTKVTFSKHCLPTKSENLAETNRNHGKITFLIFFCHLKNRLKCLQLKLGFGKHLNQTHVLNVALMTQEREN